jgi:hypothetical protein
MQDEYELAWANIEGWTNQRHRLSFRGGLCRFGRFVLIAHSALLPANGCDEGVFKSRVTNDLSNIATL